VSLPAVSTAQLRPTLARQGGLRLLHAIFLGNRSLVWGGLVAAGRCSWASGATTWRWSGDCVAIRLAFQDMHCGRAGLAGGRRRGPSRGVAIIIWGRDEPAVGNLSWPGNYFPVRDVFDIGPCYYIVVRRRRNLGVERRRRSLAIEKTFEAGVTVAATSCRFLRRHDRQGDCAQRPTGPRKVFASEPDCWPRWTPRSPSICAFWRKSSRHDGISRSRRHPARADLRGLPNLALGLAPDLRKRRIKLGHAGLPPLQLLAGSVTIRSNRPEILAAGARRGAAELGLPRRLAGWFVWWTRPKTLPLQASSPSASRWPRACTRSPRLEAHSPNPRVPNLADQRADAVLFGNLFSLFSQRSQRAQDR